VLHRFLTTNLLSCDPSPAILKYTWHGGKQSHVLALLAPVDVPISARLLQWQAYGERAARSKETVDRLQGPSKFSDRNAAQHSPVFVAVSHAVNDPA
jgi:hypothetical protein